MSKVTYLLGAGASYGTRGVDEKGRTHFLRGLPVLSEMESAIDSLIPKNSYGKGDASLIKIPNAQIIEPYKYEHLVRALEELKEMCASYPTIDALARQLYVTKKDYKTSFENRIYYEDLKRILSVALLMLQSHQKRDLRYDGFIASVIKDNKQLPPMTILSWNYDAQFELAYSGYSEDRYIPNLWKELNVLNKTYPTEFDVGKAFAMIKLNGTAFFSDRNHPTTVNGRDVGGIRDCFFGDYKPQDKYQYGAEYANAGAFLRTTLSYAWEPINNDFFRQQIFQRVFNTETLIVIGYSFPYVNNDIDSYILANMPGLRTVYIQDPNYADVKERIETMIPKKPVTVEYEPKNDKQFFIPKEF